MRLTSVLKVLGFAAGGVAAVILGAALFIWVTFDARRTESELVRYFADGYQRSLRLDGGVSLTLWPRPALSVRQATLSEARSSTTFLEASQLRLPLALGPLLSKRMVVRSVQANAITVHFVRDAKGRWNWADFVTGTPATISLADATDITSMDLRQIGGDVVDVGSNRRIQFKELRMQTGALHVGGTGTLKLRGHVQGSDPAIDGDLRLSGNYRIDSTAAGRIDGMMARLTGRVGNLTGAEATARADSVTWEQSGESWQTVQAKLDVRGTHGPQSVQLGATTPRLAWSDDAPRTERFNASYVARSQDENINLGAEVRNIAPSTGGFSAETMQVRWQVRRGIAGTEGDATSPLRVDWKAGRLEWERIAGNLRLIHPRLSADNARASIAGTALVNVRDAHSATVRVTATTGEDNVRFDTQINGIDPFNASVDISTKRLDVDRLMAPAAANPEMPFAWLGGSILSGSFNLDNVVAGGLRIDSLRVPYTFAAGKLASNGHRVSLYGGTVAGSADYDIITRKLSLDERYDNVDLKAAARDSGRSLPLQGRLSGTAQINTTGASLASLMSNANGMMRVKFAQPVMVGIDLATALQQTRNADATHRAQPGERTELADVSGNLGLRNGTYFTQSLAGRGNWLRFVANGEADPGKNTIDMLLQTTVLRGAGPAAIKDLRGKTVPLRLSGALTQPDVRVDNAPARPAAVRAPVASGARP